MLLFLTSIVNTKQLFRKEKVIYITKKHEM